jgi:diacylglycerol kinase family enzyme
MMKRIGIILNANAKKVRRGKISPERFARIGAGLVDIRVTATLAQLDETIRNFRKARYQYICIAGGDGTIHHVLTRMIKIYGEEKLPGIVLLKGGTMDNIARSVGLRGSGTAILKRLIEIVRRNREPEIMVRDTMKIGDRYCCIFGVGAVINFLQEAYSGKEKGLKQNMITIAKTIRQAIMEPETGSLFRGIEATVIADKERIGFTTITAILAGSVEGVGLGFYPLSRALERPGSFHAIILGLYGRQIISRILHIRNGWKIKHPLACDVVVRKLTIRSRRKFKFTMDGDIYESGGTLSIIAGPGIGFVYV